MSDVSAGATRAQHIFLSHGSADRSLAEELRRSLEREGFEVWSDHALNPGDLWADSIGAALREADSFVFLVGRNESESTWASIELGQALASGKKVVPVITEPEAEIPALLQGYQFLDLSDRQAVESAITRLVGALRKPASGDSKGEGIRLLREASDSLARARAAHEHLTQERMVSFAQLQVAFAIIAVIATGITLVISGAGVGADVGASIFAGLSALLAAGFGFRLGRRQGENRGDE